MRPAPTRKTRMSFSQGSWLKSFAPVSRHPGLVERGLAARLPYRQWTLASPAAERRRDGVERRACPGAVGTAGLRQVGTPAAAFATERLGALAHQVDRREARGEVR